MLSTGYAGHSGELKDCLRDALAVTSDIMAGVLAETRLLPAGSGSEANVTRIARLVDSAAWNDAALALVELSPRVLRRIVHEDDLWCCTLGSDLRLPDWLDDTIEGRHEVLPLAILSALLEAVSAAKDPAPHRTAPTHVSSSFNAVCCDNFA